MDIINVTVDVGGVTVLKLADSETTVDFTPPEKRARVAEALARALSVFITQQPHLSRLAGTKDAAGESTTSPTIFGIEQEYLSALLAATLDLRELIRANYPQTSTH